MKYYFDTCIWRDFYENRRGHYNKPLGEYANKLMKKIIKNKDQILFSEFTIKELRKDYDKEEIGNVLNILFFIGILKKVNFSEEDYCEAKRIGLNLNLPPCDVIHAIIAKNHKATIISQDKHFQKLKWLVNVKKPEEII